VPPSATVSGTPDPLLFKSARYSATTSPELQYSFAVANGSYQVNLYFAETCPSLQIVGGRVFDVQLQSALVFSALDIFAAAGKNTALLKSANVTVTNGTLTIRFVHHADNPIVSAVEILPPERHWPVSDLRFSRSNISCRSGGADATFHCYRPE
jgi:hypothetical protein